MSACDDLTGFIDGELDSSEAPAFRAHLRTCESCQSGLISGLQLSAQLSNLRPPPGDVRALIAEGRKHDRAMTAGPWVAPRASRGQHGIVETDGGEHVGDAYDSTRYTEGQCEANAGGIAWLRTNLSPLLDALTAALDDAEQLRQLNRTWVAARDAWEDCRIADPRFERISSAVVKAERALRATVAAPDTGKSPAAVEMALANLTELLAATPVGPSEPTPGWQQRVHAAADEIDKERAAAPDPEPGLGSPDEFHAAWAAEQRKEKP